VPNEQREGNKNKAKESAAKLIPDTPVSFVTVAKPSPTGALTPSYTPDVPYVACAAPRPQ
jgi:hypothetical protein